MITKSRPASVAIGALSNRSGVNIETIRYYERIGMVPKPPRTDGGHRLYGKEDVRRLAFIRRSRELGFSLDEVRALLALADDGSCAEVHDITLRHIADVRHKIADLKKLQRALVVLAAECNAGRKRRCPIIETLSADA
jgi:MerR family mercuric resistance operon transcriptional regulator